MRSALARRAVTSEAAWRDIHREPPGGEAAEGSGRSGGYCEARYALPGDHFVGLTLVTVVLPAVSVE